MGGVLMADYEEGTRKASSCGWCHSPVWVVYHGSARNHTLEPRSSAETDRLRRVLERIADFDEVSLGRTLAQDALGRLEPNLG